VLEEVLARMREFFVALGFQVAAESDPDLPMLMKNFTLSATSTDPSS
jgi:hypothetical protein